MANAYVIWHNPKCSTSRYVLNALQEAGVALVVRKYLTDPPTEDALRAAIAAMGIRPRDLLRQRNTPYDALDLGDASLTDDQLIAAMAANPEVIERPVVLTPDGRGMLCRPKETVTQILPAQIM